MGLDIDTRHGILIVPVGSGFVIRYKEYALIKEDQDVVDKLPKELKQAVSQAMMNKQPVRVSDRTGVYADMDGVLGAVRGILDQKRSLMKHAGELVENLSYPPSKYGDVEKTAAPDGPSGVSL
jgi:hypothetical protein